MKTSAGGYHSGFLYVGIAMLVIIVIVAQFLRFPDKDWKPQGHDPKREEENERQHKSRVHHAARSFTVGEELRSWQFWVALLSLTLMERECSRSCYARLAPSRST